MISVSENELGRNDLRCGQSGVVPLSSFGRAVVHLPSCGHCRFGNGRQFGADVSRSKFLSVS